MSDKTEQQRVFVYLKGCSTPIVLENIEKFKWKHIGNDITGLEWKHSEDAKRWLGYMRIEEIAAIVIEDM